MALRLEFTNNEGNTLESDVANSRTPPKVAVLLAAHNGIEWISEQVDSILGQQEVLIHLFISVDLSSDSTYEFCRSAAKKNVNITNLEYGSRYGGAARNFFRLIKDVDFSSFDYVALSDQDDIWLTDKLFNAIDCLKKTKSSAYSSDVIAFWDNGKKCLVKKSYPQKKFDFLFESAGPGCTYVFTVNVILDFKAFLMQYWENSNDVSLHDWLIYAFCRAKNYKWYIDFCPKVLYRQHRLNQFGANFGINAYLKRIKLVHDKWYCTEVLKIHNLIKTYLDCNVSFTRSWFLANYSHLRRRKRDAYFVALLALLGFFDER